MLLSAKINTFIGESTIIFKETLKLPFIMYVKPLVFKLYIMYILL